MIYPNDMDAECIPLCDALNAFESVETTSSCCGHDKRPFRIFFRCSSLETLRVLCREISSSAWRIEAAWTNGNDLLSFMLEARRDGPWVDHLVQNLREIAK